MLDEYVWSHEDVRRAADCGAASVKFKLCKHPGMAITRNMISMARRLGLDVVFGNGVQSCLGNHLEMISYCENGLKNAFEGNGFLKTDPSPVLHNLYTSEGTLVDEGLRDVKTSVSQGEPVFSKEIQNGAFGDMTDLVQPCSTDASSK